MATRAFVGIKEGNKVRAIYNHYDGYPAHLGVVLTKSYNSEEKVKDLISLGDCSFIDHRLEPTEEVEHTFDNPEKGITIETGEMT